MKWWHWLFLELLIIFGVMAWIYFFPSDLDEDFSKGMVGFALVYVIEVYRETNRRKTMSENYTVEQNAGENRIEGGGCEVDLFVVQENPKLMCQKCYKKYLKEKEQ